MRGVPMVQTPAMQTSPIVQALPSEQAMPSGPGTFEHWKAVSALQVSTVQGL